MPERSLTSDQIQNLLRTQPQLPSHRWPEKQNLLRIAKAVANKDEHVVFDNGQKFSIRYESRYDAAFVKPTNGDFVPCGYFPYDKLRGILKHGVDS